MKFKPNAAFFFIYVFTFVVVQRPREITLIGIGPLTNLALAFKTYPGLEHNVKDIFIMGGNYNGNFNFTQLIILNLMSYLQISLLA